MFDFDSVPACGEARIARGGQVTKKIRRREPARLFKRDAKMRPYLGPDDLLPFCADPVMAMSLRDGLEKALQQLLGGKPIPTHGFCISARTMVMLHPTQSPKYLSVFGHEECDPKQNSHLRLIDYLDDVPPDRVKELFEKYIAAPSDEAIATEFFKARSRLCIPFSILRATEVKKSFFGNFWLYNIRFNTIAAEQSGAIDSVLSRTLGRGYIGVTRRPFVARIMEHVRDMKSGGGHLLHDVWRQLGERNIPHGVVAQITGVTDSEDEMYDLEEEKVGELTLAPLGLNMIPGGRAGIAHLHAMGFLEANGENRDEILARAIAERSSVTPHYRRAHIREYRPDAFTFVSGCWVSARTSA